MLVQSKRNKHIALKLMRKFLKKMPSSPAIGHRRSAIIQRRGPCPWNQHCHERGRWINDQTENSHQQRGGGAQDAAVS